VKLQGCKIPKESVAIGYFVIKDESKLVGREPLGPHFWEVYVEKVIKGREKLPRPWEDMQTIQEAEGENIAWPSDDVIN